MAQPLLPEELWKEIEPLLPVPRLKADGGRPPVSNRSCLIGIIFVLKTGIPWRFLPRELGCGSGVTCWRRLRDWTQAGVWPKVHRILLSRLRGADKIDWSRAVIDSASVRAVFGGPRPGRTPRTGARPAVSIMC